MNDVAVIDAIKSVIQGGGGGEVEYSVKKEEIIPAFKKETFFERFFGLTNDRKRIKIITITIKITEEL
jgi:hypothetical protein